ncbi:MAG: FtsX-like permease family protein [Chloroflexaceae bacterium]|nr:FtsX-like permease family protein [Chloroflexaceae bacterium]
MQWRIPVPPIPPAARTAPAAPAARSGVLAPRWKKIAADLWGNRTRTLLVVLSIFVGVFAVGVIAGTQFILSTELQRIYQQANPAHITVSSGVLSYNADYSLSTADSSKAGFSQALLDSLERMPEVAAVDGRRVFNARVRVGEDWRNIQFIALDDYTNVRVNQFSPVAGAAAPRKHSILIERSGVGMLAAEIGTTVLIELPSGKQRSLRIDGITHDLHQWPSPLIGTIYAYIDLDTAVWLGESREFNQIVLHVATNGDDLQHNEAVAQQVYNRLQRAGLDPSFPQVPIPGEHPLNFLILTLTSLMSVMSVLAILLSGFLVANTISALLSQQVRQIGVMKAIGAQARQIMLMYLVLVVCFGILALVPAIPLGLLGTRGFVAVLADLINFDVEQVQVPSQVFLLQGGVAVLVPLLAAIVPILKGTRITVHAALSSAGGAGSYGQGRLDRLMQRITVLPRPELLALRNTFRRTLRLASTLLTLTLGGALFIAVFSVRDSLLTTSQNYMDALYGYDVHVFLARSYRTDYLAETAQRVPGVVAAEGQVQASVRRILADGSESKTVTLIATPPETVTMSPQILRGRWLLPDDQNALVVSMGVLDEHPDLDVGSSLVLEVNGREYDWTIVGVIPTIGGARWAYVSFPYYGQIAREIDRASYLRVVTSDHSAEGQRLAGIQLEQAFKQRGIEVLYSETTEQLKANDREVINVMIVSLLAMAVLVAAVGGLGLAGTLSLNVIERVREIGVMRAVGADDLMILRIILLEGMLIGGLAWLLAAALALPVSAWMSHSMGMMLFAMPLDFDFAAVSVLVWLGFSLAIAAIASYLPARNASRIAVREVLAHE